MSRDLHDNIKVTHIIPPVALTTTAGAAGKIIDRSGYEGVEIVFSYGAVTATNATLTGTVLEGAATGAMTVVSAANLIGADANIGIAAGTRTSGVNEKRTHHVGYIGLQRYVSAKLVPTVSLGVPCGVIAVLGLPHQAPVAT